MTRRRTDTRERDRRVELLAPAGSLESAKAAVRAGADAVYMGGSRFGARAYAQSVEENSLAEAIDYAHLHGRRLYLTLNTLLKEEEMDGLCRYLEPYYLQGVDGVIVQDLGVAGVLARRYPDLPLHGSTQMTVTGPEGARLLRRMGFRRVVPARELSLKEIGSLCRGADLEVEVFIHGAICYCYSGQCLFSSFLGGRSGNRGRCAQPCRLPYDAWEKDRRRNSGGERYLLSLKDMCTLEHLPQLLAAGVDSLKIEGRMKGPVYTAGVVSLYRKYLDLYEEQLRQGRVPRPEDWRAEAEDLRRAAEFSTRMGYTDRYLFAPNGRDMMALREKPAVRPMDEALSREIQKKYLDTEMKENLSGNLRIETGKCATIDVEWRGIRSQVSTEQPVEPARRQPLSREDVLQRFRKTGNTGWQFERLQLQMSEDAFLPVGAMNELRRRALEELERAVCGQYRRELPAQGAQESAPAEAAAAQRREIPGLHVTAADPQQLEPALASVRVNRISMDSAGFSLERTEEVVRQCHQAGKEFFLRMPPVFREAAREEFDRHWTALMASGLDGWVVQGLDEAAYLAEKGYRGQIVTDHNLYIWNREAWRTVRSQIADLLTEGEDSWTYTCPLELTDREMVLSGNHELVVYGFLPMMVSAGCVRRTTGKCDHRSSLLWLQDRRRQRFPVRNICKYCYNVIYNSCPLSLCDRTRAVESIHPASLRILFTCETRQEAGEVLRLHEQAFFEGAACRMPGSFTRGHFMQSTW